MAQRTIPLTRLMVGMYLIGVDRSWLQTPFFRHRFKIKVQSEIEALQRAGVAEVTIDTEQGLDVVDHDPLAQRWSRLFALKASRRYTPILISQHHLRPFLR